MNRLRAFVRRHWPRMRLRTLLLAVLIFAAGLPGVGAVFLRVYENTLVRQTEAELIAQGAALASAAEASWPGAAPPVFAADDFRPEPPRIDLNSAAVLPERPAPSAEIAAPDPDAVIADARIAPILAGTKRVTLASIVMLDRAGRIVSGPLAGHSYAGLPEVRSALRGRPDTVLRRNGDYHQVYRFEWLSRAADIRIHYARPILVKGKVTGVLLFSRSARSLFRGLYQDAGKIALGAGTIFLVLVGLAGLLSRGIARPIEVLSAATRGLSQGGGVPPPIPATAALEIQALYKDFAVMANAIEQRSRYLRDFAYAVSHEFKTPLAAIGGAVELLEDHGATMSEAERRQFLANIAADTARLTQLLAGVINLARADMTVPSPGAATDLEIPVRRMADAYGNGGMKVDLVMAAVSRVSVPEPALETCLSNLLENSRRAGAGKVTIRVSQTARQVQLDVWDDGPGIAAGDRERIFEPFFTTRRDSGGTGLGLAVVRSLLEAHGGAIILLASTNGAHFRLTVPAAA
jgi:signal transduction histidine kinase